MAVLVSIIGGVVVCSMIYVVHALFSFLNDIDVSLTEDDVEGLEEDFKNGLRNLRPYD